MRARSARFALLALCAACGDSAKDSAVLVFAPASTSLLMRAVADDFASGRRGAPRFSIAASSDLARQIAEGAPAGVYVSASVAWMDWLEERGKLVAGSRRDILANRLVLVATKGKEFDARADAGFDLPGAFDGRIALADPAHVPAGVYARQALRSLGWWRGLAGRVVSCLNVRDALRLVEHGDCPVGVVYASDAAGSKRVTLLATFPEESHDQIRYPGALVVGASDDASRFLDFLGSDAALVIARRHGFLGARR